LKLLSAADKHIRAIERSNQIMKAVLIATVAAFGLSGFALAGEGAKPTIMTDEQMAQIVAGKPAPAPGAIDVITGEGVTLLTNVTPSDFPPPVVRVRGVVDRGIVNR
jgi:hypothetical protein